jgi:hypothetical protein
MPPRTPPKGSSSSSSSASRRAAAAAMESPTLDARFSLRGLAEADVGDDSGLVDFAALRVAEPSSPAAPVARTTKAPTAVPRRAPRPSWGPLGPPTAAASKAKMRLLEGIADSSALEEEASRRSAAPVAGARPRARYSLFQKASLYAADSSAAAADESFAPEAHDDADDSYLHAASAPPPAMSASTAEEPTPSSRAESAEARAAQLAELRRMNETFEAYERMLLESREQVEVSATEGRPRRQAGQDEARRSTAGLREGVACLHAVIAAAQTPPPLRRSRRASPRPTRCSTCTSICCAKPTARSVCFSMQTGTALLRCVACAYISSRSGLISFASQDAAAHALSLELAARETARLRAAAEAESAAREAAIARARAEAATRSAASATATRGRGRGVPAARGRTVPRGAATAGRGRGGEWSAVMRAAAIDTGLSGAGSGSGYLPAQRYRACSWRERRRSHARHGHSHGCVWHRHDGHWHRRRAQLGLWASLSAAGRSGALLLSSVSSRHLWAGSSGPSLALLPPLVLSASPSTLPIYLSSSVYAMLHLSLSLYASPGARLRVLEHREVCSPSMNGERARDEAAPASGLDLRRAKLWLKGEGTVPSRDIRRAGHGRVLDFRRSLSRERWSGQQDVYILCACAWLNQAHFARSSPLSARLRRSVWAPRTSLAIARGRHDRAKPARRAADAAPVPERSVMSRLKTEEAPIVLAKRSSAGRKEEVR